MTPTADVFASPALPLLATLQSRGCHLELTHDTLIVEPASRLTPEEQASVRTHAKGLALLLRYCDAGVQARCEVMRRQIASAPASVVLPALLFRRGLPYVEGVCFSCGDLLVRFRIGRCWRCALAWRLAARVPITPDLARALDDSRVA